MPTNFDWRTEEDERRSQYSWDEPAERNPNKSARHLPWRFIIIAAILLATTGGTVWWRINRQVNLTLHTLRSDIVASYNLIQHAASEGDTEVFQSVLVEENPGWSASMFELIESGLLSNHPSLGLLADEGSSPTVLRLEDDVISAGEQRAKIEFSPDLNQATVTVGRSYRLEGSASVAILQQTSIFQRVDSQWLLAPPPAEFWGASETFEGLHLTATYPTRDKEIVEMFAADFDTALGLLCTAPDGINCPAGFRVALNFETDPASLAKLSSPQETGRRFIEQESVIELPTPTLVGLPVRDDQFSWRSGYALIRGGYANHVIQRIIAQSVGWRCCYNELLFNALVEYQLGQIGLKKWPIGPADHQRALESRIRLSDLNPYQNIDSLRIPTEEQRWEWRVAVDFLANGIPGTSVIDMERLLSKMPSFDQFLDQISLVAQAETRGRLPDNLDALWWLYAFNAQALTSPELVAPATQEDLLLACQAIENNQSINRADLYHYSFSNNTWTKPYSLPGYIWMTTMPDPSMALMQEFSTAEEVWRSKIWRNGQLVTAHTAPGGIFSLSFGETDPAGKKLLAYDFEFSESDNARSMVLDLNDCKDSECRRVDLPGRPVWSPSGEMALYVSEDDFTSAISFIATNYNYALIDPSNTDVATLWLGSGDAQTNSPGLTPLGYGRTPFWIDDNTYGFIRRIESDDLASEDSEEVLVLGTIGNPAPQLTLSLADLRTSLPPSIQANRLTIGYAITHPNLPQKLFITVIDRDEEHAYALSYDLETKTTKLHLDSKAAPRHSLGFSPDGRYLLMTGQYQTRFGKSGETAVLLVQDLVDGQTIPFIVRPPFFLPSVVYDWTEDSHLLAMTMGGNLVAIVDLEQRDVQLLPHNFGNCTSVVWVES